MLLLERGQKAEEVAKVLRSALSRLQTDHPSITLDEGNSGCLAGGPVAAWAPEAAAEGREWMEVLAPPIQAGVNLDMGQDEEQLFLRAVDLGRLKAAGDGLRADGRLATRGQL